MPGLYLYGFTRPSTVVLPSPGEPPSLGLADGTSFHLIPFGTIGAVCSEVSLTDFQGEEGEKNLADPAWIVPRVCRHETVLETIMEQGPVLPVRFGAVFSSRQALREIVVRNGSAIDRFLEFISGKQEWSFKAFLRDEQAVDWLLNNDPDLAERFRRLSQSPGVHYLQEKQLQAAARKQVQAWVKDRLGEILDQLRPLVLDLAERKRKQAAPSSTAGELVLNCAVLLPSEGSEGFQHAVEQLQQESGPQGLLLESRGPWPPYHFCPELGGSS